VGFRIEPFSFVPSNVFFIPANNFLPMKGMIAY